MLWVCLKFLVANLKYFEVFADASAFVVLFRGVVLLIRVSAGVVLIDV